MAIAECHFYSDVLEVATAVTVLLPEAADTQIGVTASTPRRSDFPVLYLLHGLSDDHTAWQRFTSIERYVAPLGLAVVMPAVHRSFYADEAHGHRYWTHLTEEPPRLVRSFFRVSERREDTFVAGLSMGGYGAMKWALREPDRFAAAASLSGALDVATLSTLPERRELFDRVFDGTPGEDDDLLALLARSSGADLPKLFVGCGTEDHLYEMTPRFAEAATAAGADVVTDIRPGEHEWGFWDAMIRDVLAWLPLDQP